MNADEAVPDLVPGDTVALYAVSTGECAAHGVIREVDQERDVALVTVTHNAWIPFRHCKLVVRGDRG
jgi:hypothetical protein